MTEQIPFEIYLLSTVYKVSGVVWFRCFLRLCFTALSGPKIILRPGDIVGYRPVILGVFAVHKKGGFPVSLGNVEICVFGLKMNFWSLYVRAREFFNTIKKSFSGF